jgi:hypothetical protein
MLRASSSPICQARMQAIEGFSLEQHSGPYEKWPLQSRLFHDCRDTGASVPGYVIEAQYQCAQGYLLILSHDCPYEEANDFVLLSTDYKPLARRALGVPYGSYLIESHHPVAADALMLRYFGDECLRLSIRRGWLWGWSLRLQRCTAGIVTAA